MNCKACGCFCRKDDLMQDEYEPEKAIIWFCTNCGEARYEKLA